MAGNEPGIESNRIESQLALFQLPDNFPTPPKQLGVKGLCSNLLYVDNESRAAKRGGTTPSSNVKCIISIRL